MNKTTTAKLVIEPLNMEEKEVIAAIEAYIQDDNKIGLHTYISKLPKDMVITVIRYSFHMLKSIGYSATEQQQYIDEENEVNSIAHQVRADLGKISSNLFKAEQVIRLAIHTVEELQDAI